MNKQNLIVGGDKVTTIDKKVGADGYFTDKWGNKIRPTSKKPEDKLDSVSETEGTAEVATEVAE